MNDSTQIPEWADQELSRLLPALRRTGEGQHIEFKTQLPEQAREIGREIAAFSSSGGGRILIGVADSGDLVAPADMHDPTQRDELSRRVNGISHTSVKPAVSTKIIFAVESDAVVLCIIVPRGAEPVYYYDGKPYIRHGSASRAAEPNEVRDLFAKWYGIGHVSDLGNARTVELFWLPLLDQILIEITIATDEFDKRVRDGNWITPFGDFCQGWADRLRDMIAESLEDEEPVAQTLQRLVEPCDGVVAITRHLGSGNFSRLTELVAELHTIAADTKAELIDPRAVDPVELENRRAELKALRRKATDLVRRMSNLVQTHRIDDLKQEASQIGEALLFLTHRPLPELSASAVVSLRRSATRLHLADTHRLYCDGGKSMRALADRITEATARIETVLAAL